MASLKRLGSWEDRILQIARREMKAEVCFYREQTGFEEYDPITGTGGDGGIAVFWRGKARVQHMRAPREFSTSYQAESTRFFRFQLDPAEPGNSVPFMPQGVKARVLAGGRDSHLESLAFVVISAINSSNMAVRSIELSTNMRVVDWPWNPFEESEGLFPSDGVFPSFNLYPIRLGPPPVGLYPSGTIHPSIALYPIGT